MPDMPRSLDSGSRLVILLTLALFVAALFLKGFSHDLLLEAGVFLVSVKLIIMAYHNGVSEQLLHRRLDGLEATLARLEDRLPPADRPGR